MADELERRLRESLRAYADLVDAPDDASLPARPARPQPLRRWRGALLAAAAVAAVVTGALVVVEQPDRGTESMAGSTASSRVAATPSTPPSTPPETADGTASDQALSAPAALPPSPAPGVPYAVDLFTHCGVRGLDIGGVWFAADPPLVADGGNPPPGWGNPVQPGTLTLLSATRAVFADDAGHRVQLRADESARPPLCD